MMKKATGTINKFIAAAAIVAAAPLPSLAAISIRSDYPGGNVKVEKIDEAAGVVTLQPDYRDTPRYFHWDFTLSGAAGRTLKFRFPNNGFDYLASLGPAISRDGGRTWRWLNADGRRHEPRCAFDYTFGADENETRFAVSIPYTQKDWDAAAERWRGRDGVKFDVLCKSQSGRRDTELLRIPCRKDGAKWLFAFTARHHACETTADPVMEGIIDEILSGSQEGEWIRDNADCVFIPFMDKDGVEDGDPGKNRRPHDHNRDYVAGRYTSVRAFKELLVRESHGKKIAFYDLHSPHIRSNKRDPEQDCAFTFESPVPRNNARVDEFRRNWAELSKGCALAYDGKNDIRMGKGHAAKLERDRQAGMMTSRQWVEALPNCWSSICCEFGYSLCNGVYSQDGGRELGRNLLKAAVRTVRNPAAHAAPPPPAPAADALARPLRVAVYCGDGAFGGGAFRWIQMPVFMENAEALPVDGAAICGGTLDGADVLVMPGGQAHKEAHELGAEGREKILSFVKGGGGYIGTCAGCYLAIHPHLKHPYMAMAPYRCAKSGDPGEIPQRRIEFSARAKELAGIEPGPWGVYYHGGPVMEKVWPVPSPDVRFEPIAFYGENTKIGGVPLAANDIGKIAIAAGAVGNGRVFACAVHPERDWRTLPIVKGAFKYVTGRDVAIKPPKPAPGRPKALFVTYDGFGIATARDIMRLAECADKVETVPVAISKIAVTPLKGCSAIVFPDGIGSANRDKDALKYLRQDKEKLKAFLARGGRIVAWGRGAAHLKKAGVAFTPAPDGPAAADILSNLPASREGKKTTR